MAPPLATLQSQLATTFASSAIPPTKIAYVGGLLNSMRTNYPANYTSSYLATLDPNLVPNTLFEAFFIGRAASNGNVGF